MKNYDVLILGAGASGLMCAGNLPKKMRVGIIENNAQVARKLKISGGGKCNITNVEVTSSHYDGDEKLLEYVLKRFSKERLLEFLERSRVDLELRKGRYYFCKKSSEDIISVLLQNAKGSEIFCNEKILGVSKTENGFEVVSNKCVRMAKKVVVATGGESFKNIGASAVGLDIAEHFSLAYKKFQPALVGLTLQKEQFWMKELSGLSCYVHIKVGEKRVEEEMLFAHKGISGPAVLSASLYWIKGEISIDFLPNKSIENILKSSSKKLLSSLLPLPKRLSKALLSALEVKDKPAGKLTKEDMENLQKIHHYSFSPAGNFGFSKAEVSRGGLLCDELEYATMETKKVKGLYFIGEVVDVTGELGGYNFQWAFASAYVAAEALKKA